MKKDEQLRVVAWALARVLAGEVLDDNTIYALSEVDSPEGLEAMLRGAEEITRRFASMDFDSCSIVNARSGHCSENCKWCAQSAHYHTGCNTYDIVPEKDARELARFNADRGVGRFSMVASGRAVRGRALDEILRMLRIIREEDKISTCASLGLLNADELRRLWDAGVHRYHCNMETAPSLFGELCTTHTHADKLATIRAAREIGFEICSGGIIGMGETARQRAEFAIALREVKPVSIPINVLVPIPGTPLGERAFISDEEILHTVALFRFVHPSVVLRFAGGRDRLPREVQIKAFRAGINGAITGDLLTTIGSTVAKDKEMTAEAGYTWKTSY